MRRRFILYRSRWGMGAFFGLYALIALATLPNYGITWDEIFHYISGDMHLEYFRTTKLRIEENSNLRYYGPIMDIMGAVSNEQLHKKHKIFAEDIARHLPGILLTLLIFPMIFDMVARTSGRRAGLFAMLALMLSPHFFSYMHNDPKDVGIALFYNGVLWAGLRRARGGGWIWVLLAAICFGFGFATKLTIIITAPLLALWLVLQKPRRGESFPWRKSIEYCAEMSIVIPGIGLLIGIALYPWLWTDMLHRVFLILHHFLTVPWLGPVLYKGEILTTDKLSHDYAITIFTIQNPLAIILLALLGALGILVRWRSKRRTAGQIALLGLLVTLGIATKTPGQTHDGLRQLLPILPLLSIVAGMGVEMIWRWARRRDLGFLRTGHAGIARWAVAPLLIFAFLTALYPMIALHPDQTAFFNKLVGGPRGAEGRYEVEFYLNPYKRGMKWLHDNVTTPAVVIVPQNFYVAAYYDTAKIRAQPPERGGQYYMTIPRLYLDNIKLPPNLVEVHRITAGGATVLTIYQFTAR